jgi:hypothetical protein
MPAGPGVIHVGAAIELINIRWTTPWTLLGENYAFVIAQPVVVQSKYGEIPGKGETYGHAGGVHNTIVTPGLLSWELASNMYVAAGMRFGVPDGTIQGVNGLDNIGVPYWMIQPTFALSYLDNGWDLSATLFYDIYTANPYSHVTDGPVFRADLTATKKFGSFEVGPVAYVAFQTQRDTGGSSAAYLASGGAINTCEPLPTGAFNNCARAEKAGAGGKLGYDFKTVQIAVLVTDSVLSHGQGALTAGECGLKYL